MNHVTKTGRIKSPQHLKAIRGIRFCVSCGQDGPVDAAHIRFANPKYDALPTGMGRKPDDWRTTPLCRDCHSLQHSMNEKAFWEKIEIDPYRLAGDLWMASPDVQRMRNIAIATFLYGERKA